MKKNLFTIIGTGILFLIVGNLSAQGPHTQLDCLGCHDPHYAKAEKLFKVKNDVMINPRTGTKIDHVSALCLGCHNISKFGGGDVKPIYLHMTHPVNVVPDARIAKVPEPLLRDGMIQCVSCHDPHPSNPYWKYLRVQTDGGAKVGQFCLGCHPAKADTEFYGTAQGDITFFSSMNEEVGPGTFKQEELVIANETPVYIHPLGNYKNSIQPAYQTASTQPWIWAPEPENLPDTLKKLLSEQPATTEE